MKRFLASTAIVTMALMTATFVATPVAQAAENVVITSKAAPLTQFTPQPSKNTQIGYRAWSDLLGDIILFMGPSTRQNWKAPGRELGSRISRTHNSPYRMEGNKVLYPYMRGNIKTAIEEYVVELEGIGNRIDIPAMPRNEQLAYWINLHNALVINIVAENYPGPQRKPENIKPVEGSDQTLHDAKVITIDGVPLSLRDIRERIVYPNWSSPDVPMAFYLGDASSPSLSNVAYLPSELGTQLKANAEEYVNSLRGIDDGKVSRVFHDVAPWYFPDLNAGLDAYFQRRMREEVFREYSNKGYRGVNRYDNTVNDITAGWGERGRQRLSVSSDIDGFAFGKEVQQFFVDRAEKIERLRKEPWFKRGTVTIIDIETEDTGEVK